MNRGEPSDDLSKIRGEILSSGDPFTLPSTDLIHVPNAHTGKLTPGSGTKSPKNPFFLVHSGGADTPARITGDGYKNGGEVNSTRRHSGMDVDPSGRDNHSGPGRGGDHSQELSGSLMSH
ncbi:hypothetical protein AHAS_AhasUnG0053800 [Arachis hypogaea]